jgi:hypothetical protein
MATTTTPRVAQETAFTPTLFLAFEWGVNKWKPFNFSQFVEGRRWCPWAREGIEEARVFAGDEACNGEESHRTPARFYALQSAIN